MTFYVGEERTFTGPEVDSVEHPITTWEWMLEGSVIGSGQIVKHTFLEAGTYDIQLKTTNDCGATCTETQQIIIEPVQMDKSMFLSKIIGEIDIDAIPTTRTSEWGWYKYEDAKIIWGKSDWWCAVALICRGVAHAECSNAVNQPVSIDCIIFCEQVSHAGLVTQDEAICNAALVALPYKPLECNQEFRVYDKQGNPIADGWTCVVDIYEEDGETVMERRTAPVVNGVSVISVIVDRYVRAWAEKGEEKTSGWSLGAGILCRVEPFKFYQHITCDEPTEHYASGRALLEHYDTDSDGVLTQQEAARAIMDGMSEVINSAETIFIANCWETYGGVINDMCPSLCPTPSCAFVVT